jgi:hypothetical protein
MPSIPSPFRRVARLVAEHVRRLRDSLVMLTAQVRAAVARVVGQATGNAVRDALTVILEGPPTSSFPSSRDPPGDSGFWPEQRRPHWSAQPDYDRYEERERYEPDRYQDQYDDDDDVPANPTADPPRGSLWARAVAVGCQAASWFLRRHPGRGSVIAALGVGVAAGVAAVAGGQFVSGTTAVVASALGVLTLAEAACSAATLAGVAVT